jgi:hypothetical protein
MEEVSDQRVGFIEAIEGAQLAHEFEANANVVWLDSGCGSKRVGGALVVAALAAQKAAFNQRAEFARIEIQ